MKKKAMIKNNKVLVNRLYNTLMEEIFESTNSRNYLRKRTMEMSYTPPKYWKFSSYWDSAENWIK